MLYQISIPMRYADMDTNQHINNVSSFRFFEEARVQWLASLRVKADGSGESPVVVDTSAQFVAELNYPGNVIVSARVLKIGNSSYTLEQWIAREDAPDQVVTRGSCTMVWVDHHRKRRFRCRRPCVQRCSSHWTPVTSPAR